jgi:hypothetical protein
MTFVLVGLLARISRLKNSREIRGGGWCSPDDTSARRPSVRTDRPSFGRTATRPPQLTTLCRRSHGLRVKASYPIGFDPLGTASAIFPSLADRDRVAMLTMWPAG